MSDEGQDTCDEAVFQGIFRKHSQNLYRFLHHKYGEDNNPKDVVQEAFVKLWNNCQNVRPEKARSFLFTVANNQMLNDISRRKTAFQYRQGNTRLHTSESPEYVYEENEYLSRLKKGLEELSEEQRVTFMLNRVEGKTHQEIADMLGVSKKAVEKRIYTALNVLRGKLGKI